VPKRTNSHPPIMELLAVRDEAIRLLDVVLGHYSSANVPDAVKVLHETWEYGATESAEAKEAAAQAAVERQKQRLAAKAAAEASEAATAALARARQADRAEAAEITALSRTKDSPGPHDEAAKGPDVDATHKDAEEQSTPEGAAGRESEAQDSETALSRHKPDSTQVKAAAAEKAALERAAKALGDAAKVVAKSETDKKQNHDRKKSRSSAGSISSLRLKRAQSRLSGLSLRKSSSEPPQDDNAVEIFAGDDDLTEEEDDDDEDHSDDEGSTDRDAEYSIAVVENPAATRARKAQAAATLKAKAARKDANVVETEVDAQLRRLLFFEGDAKWFQDVEQAWRRGAQKPAEMEANCGYTADCLAASEEGDALIGIGGDGDKASVCTYSVSDGQLQKSMLGHSAQVCSVAINATDPDQIASGSRDRTIRLWSRSKGECTAVLEGSEEQIYGLALRGDLLLSGEGGQRRAKARLWSTDSVRVTAVFSRHNGPVWSVALGNDIAVTGCHDAIVRLWPLDGKSKCFGKLTHPNVVNSVSLQGDVLASGCADGNVRIWSLASLTCLRTLEHSGGGFVANPWLSSPVNTVRFFRGLLISGGQDRNVKLWSLWQGEPTCIATLPHGAGVLGLAITPQGFIASAGGTSKKLLLWRPRDQSS
jgi:hypothetical protein